MGNLRSKFGKNRSTNYVTFLSTDAGRTDGRTDGRMDGWTDGRTDAYVILYSALDRQLETLGYHMVKTGSLSHLALNPYWVLTDGRTDRQNSHS